MLKNIAILALSFASGALAVCPKSAATMHASCQQTVDTTASCDQSIGEVLARINGQYGIWHDPHNNGTYAVLADNTASGGDLEMQRITGDFKYTDKINFAFTASGSGCSIFACSESQVSSIADYSTNYCNSRNLYCGTADGCKDVVVDLGAVEVKVSPSFGASKDASACLTV